MPAQCTWDFQQEGIVGVEVEEVADVIEAVLDQEGMKLLAATGPEPGINARC